MYCEFFGFKEPPFSITPNPRFIFLSKNHQEAFAHLIYGIKSHAGFIELSGEVGTGKTTILRSLISQLHDDTHKTALVLNPRLSAAELLRTINREFGISTDGTIDELTHSLNQFLLEENSAGRTVVLVIDEAQNLDPDVLEQVRMISNLETDTDKLIQIVLAGQPELETMLQQETLRQLNQRITVRFKLLPLDFNDMCSYIDHRLEIAGGWRAVTFTPSALKKIYRHTKGLPRLVNLLCDRTLLVAFTEETREISAGIVAQAFKETTGSQLPKPAIPRKVIFCTLLAVIISVSFMTGLYTNFTTREKPPSTPTVSSTARKTIVSAIAGDPTQTTQTESAATAFNMLAFVLNSPPLVKLNGNSIYPEMTIEASKRGLNLLNFSGGIKSLLGNDTPCILELKIPNLTGYRYLTLTGSNNGKLQFKPAMGNIDFISYDELATIWTGRAYIPWKNIYKLPLSAHQDTKASDIKKLQTLLIQAGIYKGEPNGQFTNSIPDAIKRFQSNLGLKVDGKPGAHTLLLLYKASGNSSIPRLSEQRSN